MSRGEGATHEAGIPDPSEGPDSGRPTLSIVVVNFQTWDEVAALADGLARSAAVRDGRCELVIVDNASQDPAPATLRETQGRLRLVLNAENRGFSGGVNAGCRVASGRWILLLNPDVDTSIAGDLPAAVLDRVARLDRENPRAARPVGIVGFALRNPDGTPQPSVGRDPSLIRSIGGLFLPRSRRKYQPDSRLQPGPVPWVTGACMLVSGELLDRVGGMDESFFLYYEEVALCARARREGWEVTYDPSLAVVHQRPLQNRRATPALRFITRHSQLVYFRKFRPRWELHVLAALIQLEARAWQLTGRFRGEAPQRGLGPRLRRMVGRVLRGAPISARDVRLEAEHLGLVGGRPIGAPARPPHAQPTQSRAPGRPAHRD